MNATVSTSPRFIASSAKNETMCDWLSNANPARNEGKRGGPPGIAQHSHADHPTGRSTCRNPGVVPYCRKQRTTSGLKKIRAPASEDGGARVLQSASEGGRERPRLLLDYLTLKRAFASATQRSFASPLRLSQRSLAAA